MTPRTFSNSALKAIRNKCIDCTGNQPAEVRRCQAFGCPLWMFRFGKRPLTPDGEVRDNDWLDPDFVRMANEMVEL